MENFIQKSRSHHLDFTQNISSLTAHQPPVQQAASHRAFQSQLQTSGRFLPNTSGIHYLVMALFYFYFEVKFTYNETQLVKCANPAIYGKRLHLCNQNPFPGTAHRRTLGAPTPSVSSHPWLPQRSPLSDHSRVIVRVSLLQTL